jgi:hypothetical protein
MSTDAFHREQQSDWALPSYNQTGTHLEAHLNCVTLQKVFCS